MLRRIDLDTGRMSVDILKKNQLFTPSSSDHLKFSWMILFYGMPLVLYRPLKTLLWSLSTWVLILIDLIPRTPPENSNGPKYFNTLESLCVTGSYFLIHHLLGYIDFRCSKLIDINQDLDGFRNEHGPEGLLTPSLKIVACEWSQSLTNLVIGSWSSSSFAGVHRNAISKCLML